MKKIFSILLSIIFAICLFCTLLLAVVRTDFSYSAITKIAGEILKPVSKAEPVNDGLFYPGDVKITLAAYEEYGDFDFSQLDLSSVDMTNLDVNELVETYLEAAIRETMEETTVKTEEIEYLEKEDYGTGICYWFYLKYLSGTPTLGGEEKIRNNPDNSYKVVLIDMKDIDKVNILGRGKDLIKKCYQKYKI